MSPPGLSRTSSVTPCTMNMVDSVTTIGCRRRKAMKKPLKAPTMPPIAMRAEPQTIWESNGVHASWARRVDQRDHRARGRSKPPVRMTIVSPTAASASVAPPPDRKLKSK